MCNTNPLTCSDTSFNYEPHPKNFHQITQILLPSYYHYLYPVYLQLFQFYSLLSLSLFLLVYLPGKTKDVSLSMCVLYMKHYIIQIS